MTKTIVIDESKCDSCGLCVKACHEGALALVDGKAKLVRPNFCDGMGDCLPACPRDAISFDDGPQIPMGTPNLMAVPGEQWPIQLALVSPKSEFLRGTLIVGADCTAFKLSEYREKMVGKDPLVIGCPKLDEGSRFDKLAEILRERPIDRVKVVRMEVPCCGQLTRIVKTAIDASGRDVALEEIVISRDGRIL